MGRLARGEILFDGCFAHVLSRSFEGRWVFADDEDFKTFKGLLHHTKGDSGYLIHHYCLMNTHFHILVSIPHLKRFSSSLQKLKWQYTDYYNKKNNREGPLWRERFKSMLVENEEYLHACGLYIEGNPVKAGMTKQPEDWPFSSSSYYVLGASDPLIDPYEHGGVLQKQLVVQDKDQFVNGRVIGSELFKLQVSGGAFHGLPVP